MCPPKDRKLVPLFTRLVTTMYENCWQAPVLSHMTYHAARMLAAACARMALAAPSQVSLPSPASQSTLDLVPDFTGEAAAKQKSYADSFGSEAGRSLHQLLQLFLAKATKASLSLHLTPRSSLFTPHSLSSLGSS